MLTRPLTLTDADDRGRGLITHPALPLAEHDDDEQQPGVFSPPAPPWSSSSSSPSSPPPRAPPSSFSSPSVAPPPSFLSSFSSFSSSAAAPRSPPSPLLPSSSSSTPSIIIPAPAVSPHFSRLSSSSSLVPPPLHPSPPSLFSPHFVCTPPTAPSTASSPPIPPPHHDSSPFSSAPLLYPPSSLISPPPPPASISPLSSPSPPVPPSMLSPSPPLLHPAPPPCCPCTSLLPRLLSAHRLEVRRLLRGALASLGRRLDSLERRSRRKIKKKRSRQRGGGGAACPPGSDVLPLSCTSSCSTAPLPPVTSSSSSSDSEESPVSPSSGLNQSKQRRRSRGEEDEEQRGRKRSRKDHRGGAEEEEAAGRFVGRMVVSFRGGAEEEAPLKLYNFNHRRRERGGDSQSEKAVSVVRSNGYGATLLLHSVSSSSSQNPRLLLQPCSQSDALSLSSGQWHFSDFTPPLPLSPNHSTLHFCLGPSHFSPAPMLRLSAVALETISESVRGGAGGRPLRPLKDRTAPPSLSSDHCYVRTQTPSQTYSARRQQKQRANHSSRSLHLPRRRPLPPPSCSANGLSSLLPAGQSAASSEFVSSNVERGKRVSQIRIRRASPRETPLTPMGLPKVKRLKKKEFSLEEIYTNKNYKSPTTNRSLETIFEEPREKDGTLLLIGQQRRRRMLLFPDFTQPRKRKRPQGAGLPVAMVPRKRVAARRHACGGVVDDESDLDVMLVERLSALEDFLTRQGLDL